MMAGVIYALKRTLEMMADVKDMAFSLRCRDLLECTVPLTWALACIYYGAHYSLYNKSILENLDSKTAKLFPYIVSIALFGVYILIKLFNTYFLLALDICFSIFGTIFMLGFFYPWLVKISLSLGIDKASTTWQLKLPLISATRKFTTLQILSIILSAAFMGWYITSKHWIANDIIATLLALSAIGSISLERYRVACILLVGLFLYDVFWVFATDVMLTVAKSVDLPIKFVFPKEVFTVNTNSTMLGLGDVVIPGWFISLLLRYDVHRKKHSQVQLFPLAYIGYALGLCASMVVVRLFKHGQPALLYIVPAIILPSLIGAFISKDLKALLDYRDRPIANVTHKKKKNLAVQ